jgi:hypothetical protein
MASATSNITNSSVAKEYQGILNDLNKAVYENQPEDVLQFCYNYFGTRLEEERSHSRQLAKQSAQSKQESGGTYIFQFIFLLYLTHRNLGFGTPLAFAPRDMGLPYDGSISPSLIDMVVRLLRLKAI